MPKTKALRDETKYRLLPPLDPDTYSGLKANIAINARTSQIARGTTATPPSHRSQAMSSSRTPTTSTQTSDCGTWPRPIRSRRATRFATTASTPSSSMNTAGIGSIAMARPPPSRVTSIAACSARTRRLHSASICKLPGWPQEAGWNVLRAAAVQKMRAWVSGQVAQTLKGGESGPNERLCALVLRRWDDFQTVFGGSHGRPHGFGGSLAA